VFEELRSGSHITNRGKRGIELDTGEFGRVADIIYSECGWEAFGIKQYEGWERHDWG
jgi:hypothetical protein